LGFPTNWWGTTTLTLWLALPLLAAIGLLYAGLWAVYVHALNGKRPLIAAIIDAVVTSFSFAAWAIMARTGHENDAMGIIAYSFGGAIGTYTILKMRLRAAKQEPAGSKDQVTE
jgi:uncharacterized BrkB/YihY/UPF0761 family membrane protein